MARACPCRLSARSGASQGCSSRPAASNTRIYGGLRRSPCTSRPLAVRERVLGLDSGIGLRPARYGRVSREPARAGAFRPAGRNKLGRVLERPGQPKRMLPRTGHEGHCPTTSGTWLTCCLGGSLTSIEIADETGGRSEGAAYRVHKPQAKGPFSVRERASGLGSGGRI